MSEKTTICQRCQRPRGEHWGVTFCNGSQQSGEVLVCPTAVFQEPEGIDDENLRTWAEEKARGSR